MSTVALAALYLKSFAVQGTDFLWLYNRRPKAKTSKSKNEGIV